MEIVIEVQLQNGEVFSYTCDSDSDEQLVGFELELEKRIESLDDIKTLKIYSEGFEIFDDEEDVQAHVASIKERMKRKL